MVLRRDAILAVLLAVMTIAADGAQKSLVNFAEIGTKLSEAQAPDIATSLVKTPDDADVRAELLGFYQLRKAANRAERTKNILWMIEHRAADPITTSAYCLIDSTDDPDGYAKGKVAWDQQLGSHATDATITANAAAFRAAADFPDAEGLLQQAILLQPKNPAWPERLALLDEKRMAAHPEDAAKLSVEALQERQLAFNLTPDPQHRFHVMIRMPDDALLAQDLIQAKRLGKQLVGTAAKFTDDPNYGDAIHRGNIVMGEAALQAGNVEKAEEYLTNAGQTPGSTTLATSGPDLHLAKLLLARGERTAVHDYLVQCKAFWKDGDQRLKTWISTMDAGGTPDF